MEVLSGENLDEYYKAMDYKITRLVRRDTLKVVPSKSITDNIKFPGYRLHGRILTITIYFQERGISSERGNLIGLPENSRNNIGYPVPLN